MFEKITIFTLQNVQKNSMLFVEFKKKELFEYQFYEVFNRTFFKFKNLRDNFIKYIFNKTIN